MGNQAPPAITELIQASLTNDHATLAGAITTAPLKPPRKRRGIVREAEAEIATQVEQDATSKLMAVLTPHFHPHGSPEIKYTEDVPERIFHMLARQDGILFTKKLVAAHLGIHRDTLYQWEKANPSVSDAIARGLAVQEAYLANLMSGGMKYSASVYAVLKNLHDWRDKVDETHTEIDLAQALQEQAASAKRVDWDKTGKIKPPPTAIEPPAHNQGVLQPVQ